MKDKVFPSWAAPIAGAFLGGVVGYRAAWDDEGKLAPEIIAFGVGVGLFAGVLVWLADRPSGRGKDLDVSDQGTFAGRFITILSLLLLCIPFVGLFLATWAVLVNPRGSGWSWVASRISLALGALISGLFVVALINSGGK